MSQLKICLYKNDSGFRTWMDLKNTYKNLSKLEEAVLENTGANTIIINSFSLQASDFEENEVRVLFDFLLVLEQAVWNSNTPDYLPHTLLEEIVNKVLTRFPNPSC